MHPQASCKEAVQRVLCSSLLCALYRHGQVSRMYLHTWWLLNFYKGVSCSGNFDECEEESCVSPWELLGMLKSRGQKKSGRLSKRVLVLLCADAAFPLDLSLHSLPCPRLRTSTHTWQHCHAQIAQHGLRLSLPVRSRAVRRPTQRARRAEGSSELTTYRQHSIHAASDSPSRPMCA